jgi:hypothetical protein
LFFSNIRFNNENLRLFFIKSKRLFLTLEEIEFAIRISLKQSANKILKQILKKYNLTDKNIHFNIVEFVMTKLSKNKSIKSIKLLLNKLKITPTLKDNYLIRIAVENGYSEIVEVLLKVPEVDPTIRDNYPIRVAVENGDSKMVEVLLENPKVDPTIIRKSES